MLKPDPVDYDEKLDITRDEELAATELREVEAKSQEVRGGENEMKNHETPCRAVGRFVQSTPNMETSPSTIMKQMRKWGLHFDGRDTCFLETHRRASTNVFIHR